MCVFTLPTVIERINSPLSQGFILNMTVWEISEFHKLKERENSTESWDLILALPISSCVSLRKVFHLSLGFGFLICKGRRLGHRNLRSSLTFIIRGSRELTISLE